MTWKTSNNLLMLESSMRFLWTKQTAILDNIANAETPGYKTKYATFEESLNSRLRAAAGGSTPVADMREAITHSRTVVREADESTRMDENGVNVTEQNLELSRNGYQQQYVIEALTRDYAMLRSAIKGQ